MVLLVSPEPPLEAPPFEAPVRIPIAAAHRIAYEIPLPTLVARTANPDASSPLSSVSMTPCAMRHSA